MATHNSEPSVDEVFQAFSNADRRKLLDSLIADSPPDDAACCGIEVDADTAMYHSHLPKLADCGLITWDKQTGRVARGPNFEAAAELLSFLKNTSADLSVEGAAV